VDSDSGFRHVLSSDYPKVGEEMDRDDTQQDSKGGPYGLIDVAILPSLSQDHEARESEVILP
jgi:hypothetical protein